ncbi:twin-arginine translocase TatA/TatE family subunit [Psychroflexus sp. ALD_RP9]|uniref:Sec-independent protein translocase subunit TatA/TatB n=1 Tax=Psychroflexus sp. ALD_RP9 TaxID=2777186 RepID=UPI001A8F6B4B|nr:twin-arginine translocase TatA/TatE family subunit [Psychroflexus sp. ALD_RP9]QSS98186.1 twin-arginine translocase TatA/TatE family subunit [Psychroflexus sp. ALD_RP9]
MLQVIYGMIGWPQIVLIAVVILLLFGGRKIPELMRGLGSGIKEFKDASKEEDGESKANGNDEKSLK